ncbi:PREDICTED: cyclin-P3-1-like [Nelumbo nucifera]|uniref:Cyclin-P3-1-like n=2 Tax=Nelumbo nucifera TaxID=4432 RepID=A0A1U8BLK6_NELNU|nr:PREDICTED: cyclin-P3-1-like [Nelumbo nucifera]XP_010277851.1 PREDICTED: cyclin-P3-1-like [Nelumbo nucifera]DAD33625.1 TPA_asm: hypothetical protein HUJ06_012476 [Nelumbo nucifera]
MGTLALHTEDVGLGLYSSLGLIESDKGIPGTPLVLPLLSSLLERSVQKNEKLLDSMKKKDAITIFHGLKAPTMSIRKYIDRIFKYSGCTPSCFVVAYIYMDRFLQQTDVYLTSLNVHRLLITAVMLAVKFVEDVYYNNAYYARVGGITIAEMNRMEMKFLFSLEFRLHVTTETFKSYCLQLEKEAAAEYKIERPIQVCGLKESWPNKDEPKCATTIARYSC